MKKYDLIVIGSGEAGSVGTDIAAIRGLDVGLVEFDTLVEPVWTEAVFISKNEIKINNETFSAEKFLIATGARPLIPNIPGIENIEYLTSRSALSRSELPESIVFVGSGFIELELGQFFRRISSTVTLIERSGRILKDYEPEIAETLMDIFEAEGIKIFNNTTLKSIENIDRKVLIKLEVNGKSEEIFTEKIVFAIGRVPNTEDIGLEEIGVEVDKNGFIKVDEAYRTNVSGIWTVGDVIGNPMATPIAIKEATIAISNMFDGSNEKSDYSLIPRGIFTDPEIGSIGLTEENAKRKGVKTIAKIFPVAYNSKAEAIRDKRGLIKMVADAGNGKIVGSTW